MKTKQLYIAINNLVAALGKDGQIDTRSAHVTELNNALFDIDGGVYKPELFDVQPEQGIEVGRILNKGKKFQHIGFLNEAGRNLPDNTPLYTSAPAQPEPFKPITADMVTDEMARALCDELSLPEWPNAKAIFIASVNAWGANK